MTLLFLDDYCMIPDDTNKMPRMKKVCEVVLLGSEGCQKMRERWQKMWMSP
jgi:hypothetical protein